MSTFTTIIQGNFQNTKARKFNILEASVMKKELVIALDAKGRKVVVINEILFKGKRNPPWEKV